MCQSLSPVQLLVIPWSADHQAPLSMGSSRQEYWSELTFPPPGDLPDPGIEPASPASPAFPALAGGFFTSGPPGKSWGAAKVPGLGQQEAVLQTCSTWDCSLTKIRNRVQ